MPVTSGSPETRRVDVNVDGDGDGDVLGRQPLARELLERIVAMLTRLCR